MKTPLSYPLIVLSFLFIRVACAQDVNFSIQYPLNIDFDGSGVENDQLIELSNGNIVQFRFTKDTSTLEHKIHLWCSTPTAFVLWSNELVLGTGDYNRISGALASNGNSFALAFPKIYGDSNSRASAALFDSNGTLIGTNIDFPIPNSIMIEQLDLIYAEGEFNLAGLSISQNGDRKIFVSRSQNNSFAMSEVYVVNELRELYNLYVGLDQKAHLIGRSGNADGDYVMDLSANGSGVKFDSDFHISDAISDPAYGTYYTGFKGEMWTGPHDALLIHRNLQDNLWSKQLITSGQMYHGSFSTDLAFHDNGIVMVGYGSVPHPITFLSKFDMDGNVLLNREFGSYQPFNYNRTSLLKHSSNQLYYTVLGGVFTNGVATFSTIFNCLDNNYQTDCDGDIITSVYNDVTISETADTISFEAVGFTSIVAMETNPVSFSDSVICSTNLGFADNPEMTVKLFPNPFHGTTTLMLSNEFANQNTEVLCFDAIGRKIPFTYSFIGPNEIQVHLQESYTGLVLFHVKNGKNEAVVRGVFE